MQQTLPNRAFEIDIQDMECPRPDGSIMLIRVARPKGAGPFPAIVDIHGGGWVMGDRKQNAIIDDALAAKGIVVAAPEFRMPPEGAYPVSISDVHLAIRWLKANAAALGSRSDLVGGLGTSSGGHQLSDMHAPPSDSAFCSARNTANAGVRRNPRLCNRCMAGRGSAPPVSHGAGKADQEFARCACRLLAERSCDGRG